LGKTYSILFVRQDMRFGFFSSPKRFIRKERGGVAVEFAIIVPVLVVLVMGIIDFGHAWYMKQIIINASREGARYGARYTGTPPIALNPSISNYILNTSAQNNDKGGVGLTSLLPDANPQVPTPTGTGYTSITPPGQPLSVTVTATKDWWVVNRFIPGMNSSITLSSTTTMAVE
jgi:Flp pilus assembly protein TadG